MDNILLYLMVIAAAIILGTWCTVMASAFMVQKRKIAARLSSKSPSNGGPNLANLSVILKEDLGEVPAFLARKAYIQVISRKLSHAFPNATLQRFLIVAAVTAIIPAVAVAVVTQNVAATCAAFAIGGYMPLFVLYALY